VPERELGLAFHRRGARRPDEFLAHELVQTFPDVALVTIADRGERARPENLAHDRGIVEERLSVRRECVEPRRDHRLHGLRYRNVALERAAVCEHACELLGVEGVSARALEQSLLRLRGQHRAVEQESEEVRSLLRAERRQRDRRRIALSACPRGSPLVQLGPRRAEDEQRYP